MSEIQPTDSQQTKAAQEQRDPDQLREEIAETREELGETVEALADKADVKARVQDKVDERKEAAQDKVAAIESTAQENKAPMIAVGIGALLLLLFLIRRK